MSSATNGNVINKLNVKIKLATRASTFWHLVGPPALRKYEHGLALQLGFRS